MSPEKSFQAPSHRRNHTYHNALTVNEFVRTNLRKQAFGLEHYTPPKNERLLAKIPQGKISNLKLPSFVDVEVKKVGYVPGPQYQTTYDWSTMIKGNKGKFLKGKKVSSTEQILIREKDKPSPVHYRKEKSRDKVLGNYLQKEGKSCFIDEAKYHGGQSPPANYKTIDLGVYKQRKEHVVTIYKSKFSRMDKLQKKEGPDPQTYKFEESFTKTQVGFFDQKIGKQKVPGFIDQAKRTHSFVPGAGTYKNVESAFNKICKSPMLAKRRQ